MFANILKILFLTSTLLLLGGCGSDNTTSGSSSTTDPVLSSSTERQEIASMPVYGYADLRNGWATITKQIYEVTSQSFWLFNFNQGSWETDSTQTIYPSGSGSVEALLDEVLDNVTFTPVESGSTLTVQAPVIRKLETSFFGGARYEIVHTATEAFSYNGFTYYIGHKKRFEVNTDIPVNINPTNYYYYRTINNFMLEGSEQELVKFKLNN